jgi:predicted acyltransferase
MDKHPSEVPTRLASVDAYRGFVMFLMMAEVLELARVAKALPKSLFWESLAFHQTHVEWAGCSLHDLIQPSFSFLVGVALPVSLASRLARGQSLVRMTIHAAWRSLVLVALGIFLRSMGRPRTNFTFEDTLTQIGLGYFFLFLLALARPRWWWLALAVILVGYWAAFALYPLPGPEFDYRAVGVPPNWKHHPTGFAGHWDKNSNLAWAFDRWFLNLFPRDKAFTHNGGGYATLSFIPTLGTMILGLIAGGWLRGGDSVRRPLAPRVGHATRSASGLHCAAWLTLAGAALLTAGLACDWLSVCPAVKRIWTPAWTLYSGGWCFLLLAGFFAVIDVVGFQAWAFPLRVIGMNSIAAYCLAHLIHPFVIASYKTHLGKGVFQAWGPAYEPLVKGVAVLAVDWLILFWMYRRKLFLKI